MIRILPLLALLCLPACTTPGPRRAYVPKKSGQQDKTALRQPTLDDLAELKKLAKVIVIGSVEERLDEKGTVAYRVLVREVLFRQPDVHKKKGLHPCDTGTELHVTDFLFREAANASNEIGRLEEFTRYVFFLSPRIDKEGEWFNMDDTAGYPLPAAKGTVELLRRPQKKGAKPGPAR